MILLATWFVFLIGALALLVYRESREWGGVPPLSLLLFMVALVALPLSIVLLVESNGAEETVSAAALGISSLGAIAASSLSFWIRPVLLLSGAASLLSVGAVVFLLI